MKRYGGFDSKNRRKYLCNGNIIIKGKFTNIKTDYLKKDIINTIIYYMSNYTKKQKDIINKSKKDVVYNLLVKIFNYIDNEDKIILIQKHIKKYIINIENNLRGPGFKNNKICKNDQDFLYLIDIDKQDPDFFYSYKDSVDSIWFFDLRSIYKLLVTNKSNPYNREIFPNKVKIEVKKLKKILKKRNIKLDIDEYKFKNKKEKVERMIIDLTVNITQSGNQFNGDWLKFLSKSKLLLLYKDLEDLWNYRLNMTLDQKKIIIPPLGILFNYPLGNLSRLESDDIIELLITEINKFELSIDEANKKLGYLYLITCLSAYNNECKQLNSWVLWV
jgi:hypothetical protein